MAISSFKASKLRAANSLKLYLIILKLLFNDDKVRSIEALIIDGDGNNEIDEARQKICARKRLHMGHIIIVVSILCFVLPQSTRQLYSSHACVAVG